MKRLSQLPKKSRRANLRLLRRITKKTRWVRGESDFRIAERLHKAGLIVAQPSKWSWRNGKRPFRELELNTPKNRNPQLPNLPK